MSLISIIATENFITVMSDGLVVDIETGVEIEQRYKKFKKISENQFIALGGDKGLAERTLEIIGYGKEEQDLASIVNPIREQLIKEIPPSKASSQIALGGIEDGQMVIYSFNNDPDREVMIQKPNGNIPVYTFISSSKSTMNLDEEIQKKFRPNKHNTPTQTLKLQEEINTLVAKVDPSVNRITFKLTIKK